jgi:hypothetical protein
VSYKEEFISKINESLNQKIVNNEKRKNTKELIASYFNDLKNRLNDAINVSNKELFIDISDNEYAIVFKSEALFVYYNDSNIKVKSESMGIGHDKDYIFDRGKNGFIAKDDETFGEWVLDKTLKETFQKTLKN